jgi:ribosomal protein S18 acetylase RimI-like enzyme
MENYGLVAKQRLTEAEITEIKHLTTLCNNYENLHTRPSFDMIRNRSGQQTDDFLYYDVGAIVGYLFVDSYGFDEKELILMVHPDYRRKGIGRTLLNAAQIEGKRRGIKRLILICEDYAPSGQAFVQAVGAQLDFAEYEMVLGTFCERGTVDERLTFRRARESDMDMLVAIRATDSENEERAREYMQEWFYYPKQDFYMATFAEKYLGSQEPVGMIRLDEMEQDIAIYGFVVVPKYRGRGYGRQILEETIRTIRSVSQKRITLEVDTTNTTAMNLYLSVGFDVETTYNYYALNL